MQIFGIKLSALIVGWALLGFTGMTLVSCTYSTPEPEHTLPQGLESGATWKYFNESLYIKKSFFGVQLNKKTKTFLPNNKLWLCGWAPVSQAGSIKNFGALNAAPLNSRHCNMKFDITNDFLVAYERNIDKPVILDDWQVLFTIPIASHFFYEKARDSRGREVNKYDMITDRGNWQERPFVSLNLAGISFRNHSKTPGVISDWAGRVLSFPNFLSSEHVEIDEGQGQDFFGFTALNVSTSGSAIQNRVRFNFLEIKDNPSFDKTYYDLDSTATRLNVLQLVGGKNSHGNEKVKAAHWDLSKPIEVCLNGFPQNSRRYQQIAIDVLNETNDILGHKQEGDGINGIKATTHSGPAFVVSDKSKFKYKYDFDLRCPSITWVDDYELSLGAPLGIGLSNANLKTGEILWGGAIIWGGLISYIVNRDNTANPDADAQALAQSAYRNFGDGSENALINSSDFFDIDTHYSLEGYAPKLKMMSDQITDFLVSKGQSTLDNLMETVMGEIKTDLSLDVSNKKYSLVTISENENNRAVIAENSAHIKKVKVQIEKNLLSDLYTEYGRPDLTTPEQYIAEIRAAANLGPSLTYGPKDSQRKQVALSGIDNGTGAEAFIGEAERMSGSVQDFENILEKHYFEWEGEISAMANPNDRLLAAKSVIKNVMLHEWGHVLGMGHQFEANRLPQRGTLPDDLFLKLRAKSKKFENYTSIMDYMSGKTSVRMAYEDVAFQIHDEHVLRYLYNQTYVTFRPGDSQFEHIPLHSHGIIPNENPYKPEYKTAYLPQCSDIEAMKGESPYCRRWDRGYDAPTIVKETYREFEDSVLAKTSSFSTASGSRPFQASQRLWARTYDVMNRNRTFYDRMRYLMRNDLIYFHALDDINDDREALKSFANACINPSLAPPFYRGAFAKLALKAPLGFTEYKSNKELGEMSASQPMVVEAHFESLLQKFESVAPKEDLFLLDNEDWKSLEEKMYQQGLEFTEVQKLCLATRKSLADMKKVLRVSGSDHSDIDFDDDVVPTGMWSGGARADYGNMYGRYKRLGSLPVKLSALDLLSSQSSTMRYGRWQVPKPKYADREKGKYSYYPLFPLQFTELITTSVVNNLAFGASDIKDTAELSLANLYMSYFLNRTFEEGSAEHHGFNGEFLDELKTQTNFEVRTVAVLLKAQHKDGVSNSKIYGFNPEIFNQAANDLIKLTAAYVLPGGKVIIQGNGNQIILPISKIRFLDQQRAYVWALEISYDNNGDKDITSYSVKSELSDLLGPLFDDCFNSGNRGLNKYFSVENPSFDGFDAGGDIASVPGTLDDFIKSVDDSFDKYHNPSDLSLKPEQTGCSESMKGVGLIGATALSLRGWILPQVRQYTK